MDVGSAGALLETVREALERGLAFEAVLPTVTSNPAKLLRLKRKGTLAAGNDADVLVLDANGAVHTLLVRGEIHVRDGAPVLRGTFE
jgi:beta-aspartyl-dipeptidase (metallo-type)